MKGLKFFLGLVLAVSGLALAAPPQRVKQPVWNLALFDGSSYTSTMAPRAIGDVYLLANATNVIQVVQTEVYWWDITREYMADLEKLNKSLPGKLEVRKDGKIYRTISKVRFCFEYTQGMYQQGKLLTGKAADAAYKRYQERTEKYWNEYMEYSQKQAAYENALKEYMKNPKGKAPAQPTQPQGPNYYVTEAQDGFIVKLPLGNYTARLVDGKGRAVPGTEKKVEAWGPRRSGIGYVARPESKWTMQRDSTDPGESLYSQGKETIYFSAFHQSQFNEYRFVKLSKLEQPSSGSGSQYVYKWRPMGAVPAEYKMEVLYNGKLLQTIPLGRFNVEQVPGASLGYNIVSAKDDEEAMFSAYKVPVKKQGAYLLRLRDETGKIVPGSTRTLESISKVNPWPIYVLALLPLLWGAWALVKRQVKKRDF
jgi:hypothetical protein